VNRFFLLAVVLSLSVFPSTGVALPRRLVLALDGVAYRDMQALQAGITRTNFWGRPYQLRAFTTNEGYFPVSRMISTFPSTSDVAWTEIFGDRPLPGYQRTYYSDAAHSQISINGVTTTMEHERQMNWQVQDGFLRTMGYVFPSHMYQYEVGEMIKHFREAGGAGGNFYAYIRASDDAQHMGRDIFGMLCELDRQLQGLRQEYRRQEGRELEIVILSDHGNNHAGRGKRVEIRAYLEKAGYHISKSLKHPDDVVLPTCGIESWVEVHNLPGETEKLAQLLTHLEGVDVVTAKIPDQTNRFLVMNSKGERAVVEWRPGPNTFRYSAEAGDPLDYLPVVDALRKKNSLDADGFAPADDWMAETLTHRYPMAPERIARGLAHVALNPATILISLDNGYVHDAWLVDSGSKLVKMGGTHGALDDLNSDGILLSNFVPTHDTASDRVAELFDGFPNVVNYRAEQDGAEWVLGNELSLARIHRGPLDGGDKSLAGDGIFLRIWTPKFAGLNVENAVEVQVDRTGVYSTARTRRWEIDAPRPPDRRYVLERPVLDPDKDSCERIYAIPSGLKLEPQQTYEISGWIRDGTRSTRIFKFTFQTDDHGLPAAY
jgi:Type I phosphodiesterase / nucleotide pyrophosphatase